MTKVFKRFSSIAHGTNNDSSDEYYTLFHSWMELFLEIICRYQKGHQYKVIICPCDSSTSVFREIYKYTSLIGSPKIMFSSYPEKSWESYFDIDYQSQYGCKPEECLIFTNPPFKGLSSALRQIKCDFLLFGSNAVSIKKGVYCKQAKVSLYIKNNESFDGNADNYGDQYGRVATCFYSNRPFLSYGTQYTNDGNTGASLMFGKHKLKKTKHKTEGENE